MSTLNEYLLEKREASIARREKAQNDPNLEPHRFGAKVRAKGRSGVREIRIRDFQIISDSPRILQGMILDPALLSCSWVYWAAA